MCDDVNWTLTKKNVEIVIQKYLYYCLSIDNYPTSKINDDYSLNEFIQEEVYNSYVMIRADERARRAEFINYFRNSFNRLTSEERKLIYWNYLDKEDNYDDRFIANNLGFSLGHFYIKKKETLIRFAYALGIETIEEKNRK